MKSLRIALLLGSLLEAGIAARGKLALELFDSPRRIDILQLARVKRMATAADIDLQLLARATGLKRAAAAARDLRLIISGVNVFLHFGSPKDDLRQRQREQRSRVPRSPVLYRREEGVARPAASPRNGRRGDSTQSSQRTQRRAEDGVSVREDDHASPLCASLRLPADRLVVAELFG